MYCPSFAPAELENLKHLCLVEQIPGQAYLLFVLQFLVYENEGFGKDTHLLDQNF